MVNDSKFLTVSEVCEDVHVIDELHKVNLWLIEGEDRALLFDTGFGFIDFERLLPELTSKPVIVLNSHIHPDHSLGNNQFDEIYCGKYDEPRAHDIITEENKLKIYDDFFAKRTEEDPYTTGWKPGPCRKIICLRDHQKIDLGGNEIEVLETPGHTLGSVSLLDRKHRLLFSGDMILTWQVWGQLRESSSLSVYLDSLKKMDAYSSEYDYLAPGHTTAGTEYLLSNRLPAVYVEGVQNILDKKVEGKPEKTFLGDGLCTLFQVGGMVYDPERL